MRSPPALEHQEWTKWFAEKRKSWNKKDINCATIQPKRTVTNPFFVSDLKWKMAKKSPNTFVSEIFGETGHVFHSNFSPIFSPRILLKGKLYVPLLSNEEFQQLFNHLGQFFIFLHIGQKSPLKRICYLAAIDNVLGALIQSPTVSDRKTKTSHSVWKVCETCGSVHVLSFHFLCANCACCYNHGKFFPSVLFSCELLIMICLRV